jgi:hypothetical protein
MRKTQNKGYFTKLLAQMVLNAKVTKNKERLRNYPRLKSPRRQGKSVDVLCDSE